MCLPLRGESRRSGSTGYRRQVFAADAQGQLRAVTAPAAEGLLGVLGIDVDAKWDQLWAVEVAMGVMKDHDASRHQGRSGVRAFELETGRMVGVWPAPEGAAPSFHPKGFSRPRTVSAISSSNSPSRPRRPEPTRAEGAPKTRDGLLTYG